ncbi:hypothetical protein BpHYR1_001722 [Brachionus plicatilis]|uniref:Uncharacterized protein n=1 Tax=Brachionus plicatilis TaxID=10195 RepID=A0A3M7SYD6_BRAPC|nr:hypothetical protein BpHYR1_001722 [Brachionus plicatilis]
MAHTVLVGIIWEIWKFVVISRTLAIENIIYCILNSQGLSELFKLLFLLIYSKLSNILSNIEYRYRFYIKDMRFGISIKTH